MKKLLSVILASVIVLSLAACSSGGSGSGHSGHKRRDTGETLAVKPEHGNTGFTEETSAQPTKDTEPVETSETTAETTAESTQQTMDSSPTSAYYGDVSWYVIDARDDYKHLETDGQYHVPKVSFATGYANEMKLEIDGCFAVYAEELAEYGNCHYSSTEYAAFLTQDGILSIIFVEKGEWDDDVFHVWNFDVTTGNKVDNSKIAAAAGVRDIRKSAMDAVQAYLNRVGYVVVEDYQLVSSDFDYMEQPVADSFAENRLNADMPIGLMSDGSVFFISAIASVAGAECYYHVYDINGNDLYGAIDWVRGYSF